MTNSLPEDVQDIQMDVQAKYPRVEFRACTQAAAANGYPCYRLRGIPDDATFDFYIIDTPNGRVMGDDWSVKGFRKVQANADLVRDVLELLDLDPDNLSRYGNDTPASTVTKQEDVKEGDRIRLISMESDPRPVESGTMGTVTGVNVFDDWTQVEVDWDNGRRLMLSVPDDKFEVVSSSPYPRRNALQALVDQMATEEPGITPATRQVLNSIVEQMGEYEHGTADIEDLNDKLDLDVLADVYTDLVLGICNISETKGF